LATFRSRQFEINHLERQYDRAASLAPDPGRAYRLPLGSDAEPDLLLTRDDLMCLLWGGVVRIPDGDQWLRLMLDPESIRLDQVADDIRAELASRRQTADRISEIFEVGADHE